MCSLFKAIDTVFSVLNELSRINSDQCVNCLFCSELNEI